MDTHKRGERAKAHPTCTRPHSPTHYRCSKLTGRNTKKPSCPVDHQLLFAVVQGRIEFTRRTSISHRNVPSANSKLRPAPKVSFNCKRACDAPSPRKVIDAESACKLQATIHTVSFCCRDGRVVPMRPGIRLCSCTLITPTPGSWLPLASASQHWSAK